MATDQSAETVVAPVAIGGMTREELDAELLHGMKAINSGNVYSEEEVNAFLAENYGI